MNRQSLSQTFAATEKSLPVVAKYSANFPTQTTIILYIIIIITIFFIFLPSVLRSRESLKID